MNLRLQEFRVLLYRFFLGYLFYFIARSFFVLFNTDLIEVHTFSEFLKLCLYGLTFDTAALFYVNAIFLLGSIIPGTFVTSKKYQNSLFGVYMIFNSIGLSMNYIDVVYYRFNLNRLTSKAFEVLENESNGFALFLSFLTDYWYVFLLYSMSLFLWVKAYKLLAVKRVEKAHMPSYIISSIVLFVAVAASAIIGIRGDWRHSTRPITLIHAMEKVDHPSQADVVLNSPFTFIRTYGKNSFKYSQDFSEAQIEALIQPIKTYSNLNEFDTPPNVVIFILESFGREYWGAMNGSTEIEGFESFTPFLDSLAKHSIVFSNAFANSRKSIHGMPSVLAGIPSFETAYTSSQYATQPLQSLVSISEEMGYATSFFHGAPNGSMGLLGFSQVLGFDAYYGKNEYNNDADFDGVWGIWDEPFFQFMKQQLTEGANPFLATVFSVSSHAPFQIPEEYDGQFKEGYIPMHKCVQYTDYAIEQFMASSKNEPWFENTLFVFTADHGNQSHYDFYQKTINRFATPVMFYAPNKSWNEDRLDLAQHMDIMPTVAHLMGYEKPIRSWGRSLVGNEDSSLVVNYFGAGTYFFMNEEYICIYNGSDAIGFYSKEDYGLENNLVESRTNAMNALEEKGKAYLQDYNNRIVKGALEAN
ncbi:MAG: LTA synthase family protein [Flavobacteriales bacterium]|jgi:phosphoglycerol transferase MdoB-like AlkP superfamily enzyme|tara:strand:+ start:1245 stop:3167 length:1923 start_codon:yes stop_codon:yes gene_type:complete